MRKEDIYIFEMETTSIYKLHILIFDFCKFGKNNIFKVSVTKQRINSFKFIFKIMISYTLLYLNMQAFIIHILSPNL